jgi:hypothetical protein
LIAEVIAGQHAERRTAGDLLELRAGPAVDQVVRVGVVPFLGPAEVHRVLGRIAEREARRVRLELDRLQRRGKVLGAETGLEHQLRARLREADQRDRIAEHVVQPAHRARRRLDRQRGVDQPQVVAVARPGHQAVLAELHRVAIAVGGPVPDVEDGHGRAWQSQSGRRRLTRCLNEAL